MPTIAGAIGIVVAYSMYGMNPKVAESLNEIPTGLRKVLWNKWYVDEAYDFFIIRPFKFLSFIFFKVVDELVIDTIGVRGTAWVTAQTGSLLRYVQTGNAQNYAAVMALALLCGVGYALFQVLR